MTAGRVTLCIALALGLVACSDDEPDGASSTTVERSSSTTTTAPERPASTTTTAFDPASVEGAVEAAYLKSWDVYADAVYNLVLDEEALAEVYAERTLDTRTNEIRDRIRNSRAAYVSVEHDYEITIVDGTTASVVDSFVNHQVLIDADTKAPIEDDPNERLLVNFQMKFVSGAWKVTLIEKVTT